ncbi:MAG: tetratricopeptide repeat protein [Pirellulaceae bacterium]
MDNETPDAQTDEQPVIVEPLGEDAAELDVRAEAPEEQAAQSSSAYIWIAISLLVVVSVFVLYMGGKDPLTPDDRFAMAMQAIRDRNAPVVVTQTRMLDNQESGYEGKIHVLKGYISLYIDDFDAAGLELQKAIDSEDDEIKAAGFALAGELLHKTNSDDQAVRMLSNAIQIDPTYQNAHRLLGAIYFDLGLMTDAVQHLRQVALLAPDDSTPLRIMGLIHKDYEQYRPAINYYRESLKRDPFQPERENVLVELAESHIKLLQFKNALVTLDLALESPRVLGMKADCLRHGEKNDEAWTFLNRALEMDETQFDALLLKGILQLESKQLEEARKTLELAVNFYPRDYRCRYKLIEVYRELNETELVEKNLGIYVPLRAQRRRFSELNVEALQKPDDVDIRYELGFLADAVGKEKIAISWLKTALKMDPSHEKAAQLLQEIMIRQSNRP